MGLKFFLLRIPATPQNPHSQKNHVVHALGILSFRGDGSIYLFSLIGMETFTLTSRPSVVFTSVNFQISILFYSLIETTT